jgi:diadenosine tetraphosphatase ApaH/serine/threonine PP2A family protein phosphatase
MKFAVISDVHANLEALEAVMALLEGSSPDQVLFLGDAVGYGPEPNECLDRLRNLCPILLMGNHDSASTGLMDVARFNIFARRGVEYSAAELTGENREYLAGLPLTHRLEDILLVHASPFEPGEWHYIYGQGDAGENFESFDEEICFVGHSHRPGIFSLDTEGGISEEGPEATLMKGKRYIVNVGSVGQPRDGDPRAAAALYDTSSRKLEIRRVPYDIEAVQSKMAARGLPPYLSERLSVGA